jgi:hypothetical protein
MSPTPILFVDHAPALGGAEQSLLLLLKHLDRTKFSLHLACRPGPLQQRADDLAVSVHSLLLPRLRRSSETILDWVSGVHKLSQVVRQMKVRLVIANTVRAALYASVAARLTGVPFIWYMRDFWLSESQPRYARLDRWGKYAIGSAASGATGSLWSTTMSASSSKPGWLVGSTK